MGGKLIGAVAMNKFSCDFETTTDTQDCRVWAWGVYNIDKDKFEYGTEIGTFFRMDGAKH